MNRWSVIRDILLDCIKTVMIYFSISMIFSDYTKVLAFGVGGITVLKSYGLLLLAWCFTHNNGKLND